MSLASTSAARAFTVLEAIADSQPVGLSELTRRLGIDKSAVQRALQTLAESGWARRVAQPPARWELTDRIHLVAHSVRHPDDLRQRARGTMEALRDETGETVILNILDKQGFVVAEVVESRQLLRTAPFVGMHVSASQSATGRVILGWLDPLSQAQLLGRAPDARFEADIAKARAQGYLVFPETPTGVSTNIAAPVFGPAGEAVAALVLSAPSERLLRNRRDYLGELVARAAMAISRRGPPI